jgi:YD repeat-containing protein
MLPSDDGARETDTLSIILRPGKVAESDEAQAGVILDYDKAGRLVSMELLDASENVKTPQSIEFALAGSE